MQSWEEVCYETYDQLTVFLKNMGRGNPDIKPENLDPYGEIAWDLASKLRGMITEDDFTE